MKRLNVLLIAVIALTTLFTTSCKDDNKDLAAPSVTFSATNGNQTVAPGTSVVIEGTVKAEGSIKEISFFKQNASFGDPITKKFDTDTTHAFTVTIPAAQVTETFSFEVQVKDKQDKMGKGSVTITVTQPNEAKPVVKNAGLKMYCAQAGPYGDGDYASLTTFETWNHSQAGSHVDLIDVWYYNGNYTKDLGGHPHLVSPDTKTNDVSTHNGEVLPNAKESMFRTLSTEEAANFSDWANINDDANIASLDMANAVKNLAGFVQGDIIAFKLQDGKMGVMKVVDGTDGYNANDYIVVDVIVQENTPITK